MDEGVGRLLDALRKTGLEDNTLVLFCSDNGGKHAYADQHPFRKGKGWLYEGGIRVPLIFRCPERIEAGSVSRLVTSTIDLLPTLLELAGADPRDHAMDGRSLTRELFGTGPVENPTLYWHYPHYHRGSGMKPASAIRMGDHKMIEWHEELLRGEHAWELYDLESDPGESIDLSGKNPYLLETLKKELHEWRNKVGAQMPEMQ
jgi:arylsulfatase A-like enzyme